MTTNGISWSHNSSDAGINGGGSSEASRVSHSWKSKDDSSSPKNEITFVL